MSSYRLDAVVITSPHNFQYYSGFITDFWESPTRPWFLILPAKGEMIAIIPEIGVPVMNRTLIPTIKSWQSPCPKDEGITLLTETLKNIGSNQKKIGWELGAETYLRMTITDFDKLRNRLNNLEFVNASLLLWSVRMIKSALEIDCIRTSCRIAGEAFDDMIRLLKLGDTEYSAAKKMRSALLAKGADKVPFIAACSGFGGYDQIIVGSTERRLDEGSVLFLDTGSVWNSYFCDFDRNYGFGSIDDSVKQTYRQVVNIMNTAIQAAKPGMKAKDLWKVMADMVSQEADSGGNVGRFGHGLGMQLTEPPSLSDQDNTILKPGMVITIEPGIEMKNEKMIVLEENIVITEDGCERLSPPVREEIPIIGS